MSSHVSLKTYNFDNIEHLQRKRNKYGIDPSNWRNGVKVESLYKDWKKGECTFDKDQIGILRKARVVSVHCFHINQKGEKLRLVEEKQIWQNGTICNRGYKFVSETVTSLETIEDAAKRARKEELQLDDPELQFERMPDQDENKINNSTTYTGLRTHYLVYHFKTEIPLRLFKESYKEVEDNVTTIFTWEKV